MNKTKKTAILIISNLISINMSSQKQKKWAHNGLQRQKLRLDLSGLTSEQLYEYSLHVSYTIHCPQFPKFSPIANPTEGNIIPQSYHIEEIQGQHFNIPTNKTNASL